MAKIVVINHLTLDGVMQSPGRAEEDTRGGFAHGGWGSRNSDEEMLAVVYARVNESGGLRLLLGRWTYEEMLGYWNTQDSPFKDGLNNAPSSAIPRMIQRKALECLRLDRWGGATECLLMQLLRDTRVTLAAFYAAAPKHPRNRSWVSAPARLPQHVGHGAKHPPRLSPRLSRGARCHQRFRGNRADLLSTSSSRKLFSMSRHASPTVAVSWPCRPSVPVCPSDT